MSGEHPRRSPGRRDNGLQARSYFPLQDVDPRVGEHLLDVLYLAGIAAYLKPSVDTDAVTRATSLPRHPSDRVWVDKVRLADARALLGAEATAAGRDGADRPTEERGPTAEPPAVPDGTSVQYEATGPPGREEPSVATGSSVEAGAAGLEAAFAAIVAAYDRRPTEPVGRWSAAEDVDDDEDDAPDGGPAGIRRGDASAVPGTSAPAADGPRDWTAGAPATDDERFVPPPPPPLPPVSRGTAAALVIVLLGVVLFVFPDLLGLTGELALAVPIGAIVVGASILIWRMHDGPSADDGPDDGAVV